MKASKTFGATFMFENQYQMPLSFGTADRGGYTGPYAGFGVRLLSHLFDSISITLATATFFYLFLGFDETIQRYLATLGDINARIEFLAQRNQVRDLSFLVYIVYCALLEGSAMQGTVGKRLLGLRVTGDNGERLSMGRSFGRNFAKILSYIPLGLGFLCILWSDKNRAWHDMIAKTLVIKA